MLLGLKYCGGCSARYDRAELARTIKEELGSLVEWVPHEDPEAEHLLVIAGCESACVDLGPFEDRIIHLIVGEEDLGAVVRELTSAAKGIDP